MVLDGKARKFFVVYPRNGGFLWLILNWGCSFAGFVVLFFFYVWEVCDYLEAYELSFIM